MLELGGQQPSNAMVAMNQLTTGGQNLATVNRRRKKPHGVPNPKRMFEEVYLVTCLSIIPYLCRNFLIYICVEMILIESKTKLRLTYMKDQLTFPYLQVWYKYKAANQLQEGPGQVVDHECREVRRSCQSAWCESTVVGRHKRMCSGGQVLLA